MGRGGGSHIRCHDRHRRMAEGVKRGGKRGGGEEEWETHSSLETFRTRRVAGKRDGS